MNNLLRLKYTFYLNRLFYFRYRHMLSTLVTMLEADKSGTLMSLFFTDDGNFVADVRKEILIKRRVFLFFILITLVKRVV